MPVVLTEVAELKLRTFIQASNKENGPSDDRGIRISVNDGGCSGYSYGLDIATEPKEGDILQQQGKLRVYIDSSSASLLEGVVIDYVDSLIESGFKFSNPNASSSCGCGQSFSAGDCTPAAQPCT
ncbi:MAG: iron-sulfur cluster assembly accessory protein [Leptolyngbyaceae cyanobacterium bins.59]|nr:iron-sulfur cluster assembly accessory protein [Leptolyngbyaceae cyanobacterium bins.59]